MKKWELLNETAETPQSMEEMAIELLTFKIIEEVENLPPMTMVATVLEGDWYKAYKDIKEHLNEKSQIYSRRYMTI